MATIKDVAKHANVSITTVSRVLNNKPDVSDDTKNKILNVMKKLNYNPNSIARGLVLQKTNTIGLIIPDISNPFFPEVARGVEDRGKELGYSIIFINTDNQEDKEREAIKILKSKQVDGLILSFSISNKDELKELKKEKYPVVEIDRKIPGLDLSSVTIDNVLSAYKATKHLIRLNHKKIAHITGDLETQTGRDRLKGFKKALDEYSIDSKRTWVLKGDYSKQSGYKNMKKLLDNYEKPTAVFAANDFMAVGCYEAIFEYGLSIPKDISIMGHDNTYISSLIQPKLTTMNQFKHKLGEKAAEILIEQIEKEYPSEDTYHKQIVLDTKLVVRNSTKELVNVE